jgi:hypothetical protein
MVVYIHGALEEPVVPHVDGMAILDTLDGETAICIRTYGLTTRTGDDSLGHGLA